MPSPRIMIVEDEPDIGELIRFHIQREGYDPVVIASGRTALEEIKKTPPDLLVLDLMLPDVDGLEVCRNMKWEESTRSIPIVIVSAKGEESDIVAGLELGAEDYVTKPFSPKVLMARIRNVMRRQAIINEPTGESKSLKLADGVLRIDVDRHTVFLNDQPLEMTHTEFGILHYLAKKPGFVRTRDQILSAVHGDAAVLTSRTVDVHLTAIRKKLGKLGPIINTVRGVGYRLDESSLIP